MPTKAPTKSKKIVNSPTASKVSINSGFVLFLEFIEKQNNKKVAASAKHCLDLLCSYATDELPDMLDKDLQLEFKKSGQAFCDWAPAGMVGLILDRFFRYHLIRELITTAEMRGYAANAIFHCLRWLAEQELLSEEEMAQVIQASDHLVSLGELSYNAALDLAKSLTRSSKPVKVTKVIEMARHDVTKIDGGKMWLEIWAPIELPTERKIGPIDIPLSVARVLEPGWMVECMLGLKQNGKWDIIESGSIYPSLPFN